MENILPSYRFDRYLFRPAEEKDLALAQAWNRSDPDHVWEAQYPTYWIGQSQQANSYVLEDEEGIVFFVKSIRMPDHAIEITLQFDRSGWSVSRQRSMQGMLDGFEWLKKALVVNGFRAVYFVTKNPQLGAFAVKRLGFSRNGDRYSCSFHIKEMCNGR
jgi:hypothetical protein